MAAAMAAAAAAAAAEADPVNWCAHQIKGGSSDALLTSGQTRRSDQTKGSDTSLTAGKQARYADQAKNSDTLAAEQARCAHQTRNPDTMLAGKECDGVAVMSPTTGSVTSAISAGAREGSQTACPVILGGPDQRQQQTFAQGRAEADLRIARRTVVAGWRGALTREIRMRQARQEWRLKKAARLEPT